MIKRFLFCVFLLTHLAACIHDESEVELIVGGLGIPWGMTFVDDERVVMTEKAGSVKIVDIEKREVEELEGVPAIDIIGQGGLMDVAKSPNFSQDSILYFTYAKPIVAEPETRNKTTYATALATARLDGFALLDWRDLFISNLQTTARQHFGSRIAFDDKGFVFFTHGDRGERKNSQDLSNHGGTVLRLHLDGSVPADNPFVDAPNALPEIWSYGHRNPQGIVFDQANQRLWSNEHGPKGGDEINLIEKGGNYGWPILSYGSEYVSGRPVGEATEREGFVPPMKYYDPSIAPSSLILYTGDKFPQFSGSLLSGALVLRHLNVVELDALGNEIAEKRYLKTLLERIRNVAQSPGGDIYLTTDAGDLYKLLNVSDQ